MEPLPPRCPPAPSSRPAELDKHDPGSSRFVWTNVGIWGHGRASRGRVLIVCVPSNSPQSPGLSSHSIHPGPLSGTNLNLTHRTRESGIQPPPPHCPGTQCNNVIVFLSSLSMYTCVTLSRGFRPERRADGWVDVVLSCPPHLVNNKLRCMWLRQSEKVAGARRHPRGPSPTVGSTGPLGAAPLGMLIRGLGPRRRRGVESTPPKGGKACGEDEVPPPPPPNLSAEGTAVPPLPPLHGRKNQKERIIFLNHYYNCLFIHVRKKKKDVNCFISSHFVTPSRETSETEMIKYTVIR